MLQQYLKEELVTPLIHRTASITMTSSNNDSQLGECNSTEEETARDNAIAHKASACVVSAVTTVFSY